MELDSRSLGDALNSSIDGIVSMDREFRIRVWNQQMERFSGMKFKDVVGKSALELFPLLGLHKSDLQKTLKGKICIIKGMHFNPTLNNGLEDYYEGYYSPVRNDQNEITGALGVIRELGYRSAAEQLKMSDYKGGAEGGRFDFNADNLIFEDIISLEEAQRLQDSFAETMGVASIIVDPQGNMITQPSNFTSLCSDLILKTEAGAQACKKSFEEIGNMEAETTSRIHTCEACGLWQSAAVITVGSKRLANWVICQVKTEKSNIAKLKKRAHNLKIDEIKYLEALEDVHEMTMEHFRKVGGLHNLMAQEMCRLAAENVKKDQELIDRKRIENQLINITNRREELARIINKSPAIAFLWNQEIDRPVSFVTENINQFGYAQEEFHSGKTIYSEIIFKEDVEKVKRELRQYMVEGEEEIFSCEYRIVTKHGGVRWVAERSWRRRDLEKGADYLEGLLVDITVRKFAEEALIASEEHFKLLFERAPIGMALLSLDGEIARVNKSFCDSIGYDPDELNNIKFSKLLHNEDVAEFESEEKRLSERERTEFQLENKFVKKSGQTLNSITKVALILDAKGRPTQELVQIVDITNRKKAENDLLASQSKLHQAQSFAHLGNWELDLGSNEIKATDEVYRIYGFEQIPESMRLQDFLNPIAPEYADQVKKNFYNFLSGSKADFSEEYKIAREGDGKLVAVQTKAELVMGYDKEPKMVLGTIQDITERKETEEELKTRNHELTNFVYKVSHDLRSPLLSISGLLNLMHNMETSNEMAKYLYMIGDRVKRLDTFIMDILSHSKNLYTDISVEKIDFEKIIERCFNDLSYLENALRIKRNVSVADKVFYSDAQRLKDIFRNLISNAILYLHTSKKENFLNIDVSISERYASIVIEDNGLGIEKSVAPRIFDMFFRGIEISSGSGIGLYIVRQTVERLGGNISVESANLVGTKFFITIPNLKDQSP